jgi:hypothetical protein
MRKLLVSTLILSSLVGAAPAVAQNWGSRGDSRYDRQIDQLIDRIHRAEARDLISRREEDRLLRQARSLDRLEDRYSRNGLTRWEAQDLQRRIANLRAQLRWERHDGPRYRG